MKRLVELRALVIIEIIGDRSLTEAFDQPLNEIDPLGLGQAEQLGHQLRRNRHDVLLLDGERPAAWARWKGSDVRRKILSQFPYSIFYVVENDAVVIVAIAHHKRRPGYWKRRLRQTGS